MGVPGFYRWAVRKVPHMRQKTSQPPYVVDHFYLDFNGVVHGCVQEWGYRDTENEEALFRLIEQQLAFLLAIVTPTALLYVALDGVAPRAKMNQQRSRRFRAAKEAGTGEDGSEDALEGPFDKNAITPGTPFMRRLNARLCAWAESAAASLLRGAAVVISSDRDPGEGEHKIMEVIRHHPDRVHCLFSNDADLVFLGLVSPADHVYLLRIKHGASMCTNGTAAAAAAAGGAPPPGAGGRAGCPCEDEGNNGSPEEDAEHDVAPAGGAAVQGAEDYELLCMVAIRAWLTSTFPGCDPGRVIADFVAMCCLAGNDFLPHMDVIDIYAGGLDRLMRAYGSLSPVSEGYLVGEDLKLVLPRWRLLVESFVADEVEALLNEARLGLGYQKKSATCRSVGPPNDTWDGLSVLVAHVPGRATAADLRTRFSEEGCAVEATFVLRGNGSWLVQFADPASAATTLVATRRICGVIVKTSWADPSTCKFVEPQAGPHRRVDWRPALAEAIRTTVEYWFGPGNLPNDAFLRRQVRADSERFVPLRVLTTFNRLRIWSQDLDFIAEALRPSSVLEVRGVAGGRGGGAEGELAVRALADHSVRPGETPEQVLAQRRALQCVLADDSAGAAHGLQDGYYLRHHGPTSRGAPPASDAEGTAELRSRAFLAGIEWVLGYYVRGCPSWTWFYPAHYPPLCASLVRHATAPLESPPLQQPLPPELQLLAVLPPQSAALLPAELRPLLVDPASPVAGFYPRDFATHLKEGDREWQAIALLPFIDEEELRAALRALPWDEARCSPFEPARAHRCSPVAAEEGVHAGPDAARWEPSTERDSRPAGSALQRTSAWDFCASECVAADNPPAHPLAWPVEKCRVQAPEDKLKACGNFQQGWCEFGARCRFSHELLPQKGRAQGAGRREGGGSASGSAAAAEDRPAGGTGGGTGDSGGVAGAPGEVGPGPGEGAGACGDADEGPAAGAGPESAEDRPFCSVS